MAVASWFETRGVAALLTMTVYDLIPNEAPDLIPRSIAKAMRLDG
jgi:hypothetical protein